MSVKKVLIIGANGQIGKFLLKNLDLNGAEIYGTTRRRELIAQDDRYIYLDLISNCNIKNFECFDIAVFCAGITSIKFCEQNKSSSNLINVTYTNQLIKKLIETNIKVLYLSSNKVFNGNKPFCKFSDLTSPNTVYGLQKTIVENSFMNSNFCTLRLTKVLSNESPMIQEWTEYIKENKKIKLSCSTFISPISLTEVGEAVKMIIKTQIEGNEKYGNIYHLGGRKEISLFHFAQDYLKNNFQSGHLLVEKSNKNFGKKIYNSLETYLPT